MAHGFLTPHSLFWCGYDHEEKEGGKGAALTNIYVICRAYGTH